MQDARQDHGGLGLILALQVLVWVLVLSSRVGLGLAKWARTKLRLFWSSLALLEIFLQ